MTAYRSYDGIPPRSVATVGASSDAIHTLSWKRY